MMEVKKEYRSVMVRLGIILIVNTALLMGLSWAAEAVLDVHGTTIYVPLAVRSGIPYDAVSFTVSELINGAIYLFSFMFPVALFAMISGRKGREPMRLGVRMPVETPLIVVGAIGLILGMAILNNMFFSAFDFSDLFETEPLDTPYKFLLSFITTAMVPGFCEEFLFRGCVLSNMLPYGRTTAIIGSAAAFALMHGNPVQYLYTFAAGIVLGIVYEETGSIWPGTFLHICNNYFSVLTEQMDDTGTQEIVLMMVELGLMFAAGAALVWLIHRRKGKLLAHQDGAAEPSYSAGLDRKNLLRGYFNPAMIVFVILSLLEAGLVLLSLMFVG